jgi:hypothetical protein
MRQKLLQSAVVDDELLNEIREVTLNNLGRQVGAFQKLDQLIAGRFGTNKLPRTACKHPLKHGH